MTYQEKKEAIKLDRATRKTTSLEYLEALNDLLEERIFALEALVTAKHPSPQSEIKNVEVKAQPIVQEPVNKMQPKQGK